MSISRPSPRLRRLAASTGALALAGILALSGGAGEGVQMTEAAWSDTEVAQASVTAAFPVPTDSWVRATANNFTNHGDYSPAQSPASYVVARTSDIPAGSTRALTGTQGNEWDIGNNFGIRQLGSRTNTGLTFCSQASNSPSPLLPATYPDCTGGSAFTADFSMARTRGFGTAGGFAHPAPTTSEDILAVEARNIRTMAECSPTGESRALAPSASESWGGDEPYGEGTGIGFLFSNIVLGINPANGRYSYLSVPAPNTRITRWMRPLRTPSLGVYQTGRVFFRATITSRQYATYGYALSDLYVQIDQYRTTTNNKNPYSGSFTMVLSRSECGLTGPAFTHQKLASIFEPRWRAPATSVPAYAPTTPVATVDAPLPRQDGTLSYPGDSDFATLSASNYHATPVTDGLVGGGADGGVFARGMRVDDPAAADLPPTTTVTSPLETTTASETTTSAPPNPSGKDESPTAGTSTAAATTTTRRTTTVTSTAPAASAPTVSTAPTSPTTTPATQVTTSTSAAPAIVIPDEPAPLSPGARLEDVGTATVGGDDLVVVVEGTSIPTDAQQGLAALEIWLGGGDPGDDWEMFASTDPDADGWRWAAINQESGTVVYIR